MVSESTWRVHGVFRFILARNYIGFGVDMESTWCPWVHFSQELLWFRRVHGEYMLHGVLEFILARNYNGFGEYMESTGCLWVHFNKELHSFFGGHGLFSSSESSF